MVPMKGIEPPHPAPVLSFKVRGWSAEVTGAVSWSDLDVC